MFNVDNSIDNFLQNQKYQELQELLETKLESDPDNLISYIYLGLVYFLLDKREEAQATWFLILMAEDEITSKKLTEILDQEAHRQWEFKNYQLSYNLREIIKDNNPYLINNLLLMAELAINLQVINNDYLVHLSLLEAIRNTQKKDIDTDILFRVFEKILDFPFLINIDLAAVILKNQNGDKNLLQIISNKAHQIGLENNYLYYGAELTKICLQYQPDNLSLIKQIYKCYNGAEDFHKLEETALNFIKYSTNDTEKLYGIYLLMCGTIQVGKWDNYLDLYQKYFSLLSQLELHENNNFEGYIEYMLVSICQFLLYFNDTPKINREVINKISNLYQKLTRKRYTELLENQLSSTQNNTSVKKKLKIGFLSEALRVNCVGILSRWLIQYIDRDKYDIYIYKIKGREDFFTNQWFQNKVTQYYCFDEIKDTYEQIKKDEIDILMELDSFTHSFTNAVMTLKPAPIQVSWLGLDSTGIPAVDYFIVDSHVLPEDASQYYREKIWRLPHTYIAVDGFEVNTPSLKKESLGISNSAIIYLSLQTGLKRHPEYIRLQMKILQQVANSYFLVSGYKNEWSMSNIKNLFTEIAQQEGVNPDRIKFLPYMPLQDYRANLFIGDVVLDTYPFNGATTTLDALWSNIPLVTRVGQQFHARQGYTFLQNLGITEGIAYTDEEYIQWGVKFGTDEELRKKVYWKLKESKKTSPLWNGKQFAREMEKAYQQMWEIYLQGNQ